jgi:2-oxoglutarate ferredoxin oxidoreductase subunit beta
MPDNVRTDEAPTWCPGCFNFQILAGTQKFFESQLNSGKKKKDFAVVMGIGCHAKMFDYLDMPGINTLHGRVVPTCTGIKLAKSEVSVFGFSGDGDAYAEGMEHLIHAAHTNSNIKYVVHNNQVFALTLGEPTPVTDIGFKDKTTPRGVAIQPMNPIKLMLAAGATFVARVYADVASVQSIMEEAMKHKGFAFIEIIQPCIIFHADEGYQQRFYNLQQSSHNTSDIKAAMERAEEFDYNSKDSKIPIGIFYKGSRPTFEENKLNKQKT